LTRQMSRGRPGEVVVRVRDANNRERTLTVPRRNAYRAMLPAHERPAGTAVRVLSDGIAYADIERLTDTTIAAAFATLASARGVVLDLRGTLPVDDMRLLQHLATRSRALVGRVVQRSVTAPCLVSIREAAIECPDVRETRSWWRTADTAGVLTGRIVALIDERTSAEMERFALSLEQLSAVTFIGSASAGSLSWATPLSVPGQLTVGISTQEIRRADGGQVQRIGLTPVVDAKPTARGLRAGEDEVLTRAHQWLQQQLEPPRRRR
ncbi:MAG: S41 family peptidase, partial [Gemmatimonas sp.]